ncbi:formylglycine-generating enzyme family protein [Verrucomicrobia bacterium S94]|nr:formylglycine-generating enzyme family protein [Verrucomicrobia bacterium S94]
MTGRSEYGNILRKVKSEGPFYVGKYEVTQEQWEHVMGYNPSCEKCRDPKLPVNNVLWDECERFVEKLCELEGVAPGTYRLLYLSEWNVVARGGTRSKFYFGEWVNTGFANIRPVVSKNGVHEKGINHIVYPGQYPPNAWGLYDLYGNVEEYVLSSGEILGKKTAWGKQPYATAYSTLGGSFSCSSLNYEGGSGKVRYDQRKCGVGFRIMRISPLVYREGYSFGSDYVGGQHIKTEYWRDMAEASVASYDEALEIIQKLEKSSRTQSPSSRERMIAALFLSLSGINDVFSAVKEPLMDKADMLIRELPYEAASSINILQLGMRACNEQGDSAINPEKEGSEQKQIQEMIAEKYLLPVEVEANQIHFRLIPPGGIQLGSAEKLSTENPSFLKPTFRTFEKPFYCGKYEITQGDWERVMGTKAPFNKFGGKKENDFPVRKIYFYDAQEFVRMLCIKEGVPIGTYRLLTEAEWEYACRAGEDDCDNIKNIGELGWFAENSGIKRKKVGTKNPNSWGLYDMQGNCWEWCISPHDDEQKFYRIVRGGSAYYPSKYANPSIYYKVNYNSREDYIGFRIMRIVPDNFLKKKARERSGAPENTE